MENTNGHRFPQPGDQVSSLNTYASNGKIMLFSGILLFATILIILCFHSYARWIFNLRRRRRRQQILSLSAAELANVSASDSQSKGLDPSILKSLPVLVYSTGNQSPPLEAAAVLECAVCLSEFEDGEVGRVLPACKHTFHSCCIDMWFHSHSNCPLCRAPVQYDVCKIRSDTVVETAELRKKVDKERFCSASSPPYAAASLPLVQCQMITADLVEILVEVPTATSSGEQTVTGLLDMGSGPSGLNGPKPTSSDL